MAAQDNECLAAHFPRITRLTLKPANNLLNTAPLQPWHGVHLRELISTSRSLLWVTAALQTFPDLAMLRLSQVSVGSNVTKADIDVFEAEVCKADRRGMELIRADVVRSAPT